MDDAKARRHIQARADAVVSGDFDHVVNDFTESLRPQVPEIAKILPRPVESAEVISAEPAAGEMVAHTRYSGGGREATIRSHWREEDGIPRIVHGEPA